MADLYSIIAGIQPDQQDILEAELFAQQILQANFPSLDLREGTAIRDLNLRPAAFILALCKTGTDYYFSQNTIGNLDDTTPTTIVDDILGNLFLTRNLGTQAIINARLYFARQKSVSLTTGVSFSTDGTLLFYPVNSATYSTLLYDSYQNEYYVDVDLIAAETGTDYNLSTGSLLYFTNFDPYFLHAEINYLSQASIAPETNTEFISRAQSSISTRNLINKPSIESNIKQTFNYVDRITTNGAGDPEIYRDQVLVSGNIGVALTGTAMALSDSNTKLDITLPNHGLIVGQLVNVTESGSGSILSILGQPVSDVISPNEFKILLPITVAPRTFSFPYVNKIEEDLYVHQGGIVDVHIGDKTDVMQSQVTLDANGQYTLVGPYYNVVQSATSGTSTPDTVPSSTAFTVSYPHYLDQTNISLSQDSGGVLTATVPSHPLSVGRYVSIYGWPTDPSYAIYPVTKVIDENTVILGDNLPVYSVTGVFPRIRYVYPTSDAGFSTRQSLTIDFTSTYANGLVTLDLSYFTNLDSVQSYLELSTNRVLCADLLVRGFDIYVLDMDIVVHDITAPATGTVSTLISNYLSSLDPGAEFILGDLVASLNTGGIAKLKTPLTINYTLYTKDLLHFIHGPTTGTITDILKPDNSTTVFILGTVTTNYELP